MRGQIKTRLTVFANARHRPNLAALFRLTAAQRAERCDEVSQVIEVLRFLPVPQSMMSDDIGLWLPARSIAALRAHGIDSLADLTMRIARRRRWWISIIGLGPARAKEIESLFAAHPQLTERARALVAAADPIGVTPWERPRLPHEIDGSSGGFRAPQHMCTLNASNDYKAVQAWLSLHEAEATRRAYRKEAERLMLCWVACAPMRTGSLALLSRQREESRESGLAATGALGT